MAMLMRRYFNLKSVSALPLARVACACLALPLCPEPASAQTPTCSQTPVFASNPGPQHEGYFTSDINLDGSGNLAIIGEIFGGGDYSSHGPGLARIYASSLSGGWTRVATLQHQNGQPDDGFGASVDISGSYAVITAPDREGDEGVVGAVYFFKNVNSVWQQQSELFSGDVDVGFGGSLTQHETVAIDGPIAVVGASRATLLYQGQLIPNAGQVYVYSRNPLTDQWGLDGALTAPVPLEDQKFGYSVELSGGRIIVGAPYPDTDLLPGKAYIFKRVTTGVPPWSLEGAALVGDSIAGDHFGRSVSIDGNTAVVGAPGIDEGDAFVFTFNATSGQWQEQAQLQPSNLQAGQDFGYNVSLSGSLLLVGAPTYNIPGGAAVVGAAYVFQRMFGGWTEALILLSSVGATGDRVGETLALRGDEAFVGVLSEDYGDPDIDGDTQGALMIFSDVPSCP